MLLLLRLIKKLNREITLPCHCNNGAMPFYCGTLNSHLLLCRFGRSPSDLKKEAKRDVYLRFGKSGSSNTDYMGFSKSEAEPDAEL